MVKKLLERAIEIEGLLRIIRDGNPLPETYTLLRDKSLKLAEDVMQLDKQSTASSPNGEDTKLVTTSAPNLEMTGEVQAKTQEPPKEGTNEGVPTADDEEDEDDILLTIEDEEVATSASETEPQKEEEMLIIHIENKKTEKKPEILLEKDEVAKPALKRQTKLKSAFSLNDRFLYARELFEGNMKMFDSTLDFIEGIEEYSIIEDYFYNELEWDPENMAVASFMEILRPHFRE